MTSAVRVLPLLAALVSCALAACGDDPDQRSEANYCTQVGNHLADLNSPAMTTEADIDRVVGSWKAVAASAPLAIEAEWDTMVANLETAVTVDPSDAESMQKVADTARASEPAANRVISYTQQRCGALIGSVTPTQTTILQTTVPATTAPKTTVLATTVPATTGVATTTG